MSARGPRRNGLRFNTKFRDFNAGMPGLAGSGPVPTRLNLTDLLARYV
jgi:hypothetical protein